MYRNREIWILVYSFKSLNLTIAIFSSLAMLVCLVYGRLRTKSPEINLTANVWAED